MSHASAPAMRAGFAGLAAMLASLAVAGPGMARPPSTYPYTLADVGTFGGPQADVANAPYLNASGLVVGTADTADHDPFGAAQTGAFNGDPFVQHAYGWRHGTLTDLGALGPRPAANSSYPNAVNDRGDAVGISNTGAIDAGLSTAATHAVLWRNGGITDLGTLGGEESQAFGINDREQVVGAAANDVPDAHSMLGWLTQTRAFLWQRGRMRDLGTLGGPDSFAWFVTDRGQVAGVASTTAVVDPVTGQPPSDAFLWQNGTMRDLGNLGGSVPAFGGVAAMNARGLIVGQSDLAGDQTAHPYLWDGHRMRDLGTLGGDNGGATALNDRGTVAGIADLADGTHRGFLWTDGRMRDLPPVSTARCSNAWALNDRGEAVGNATDCRGGALAAALWRDDRAIDLNTLIAPSDLHLTNASGINDAGEIIGEGTLPNGDERNFVMIPRR